MFGIKMPVCIAFLLCMFCSCFAVASDRHKKDEEQDAPVLEQIKVKGRVYGGEKLMPGVQLVFVSYANDIKLEKTLKKLDKYYKKYCDACVDYKDEYDQMTDDMKDAKKNYKVVQGSSKGSLNDVLRDIRDKYDKKLRKYYSDANDEKHDYVREYNKLLNDLRTLNPKEDSQAIVRVVSSDNNGWVNLEAPKGLYYMFAVGAQSVRGDNREYYIYDTMDVREGAEDFKLKVNESKIVFSK